jgi:hypothetical protein
MALPLVFHIFVLKGVSAIMKCSIQRIQANHSTARDQDVSIPMLRLACFDLLSGLSIGRSPIFLGEIPGRREEDAPLLPAGTITEGKNLLEEFTVEPFLGNRSP